MMLILTNLLRMRHAEKHNQRGLACLLMLSALFGIVMSSPTRVMAQSPFSPAPTQSSSTQEDAPGAIGSIDATTQGTSSASSFDDSTTSLPADQNATVGTLSNASGTMSAEQIIQILQTSPDLTEEVKTQVADRLQQQGTPVEPSDITDQMLFDQIQSNADLRSNLSVFLKAKGYTPSADTLAGDSTTDVALGTSAADGY
jgi:hypothetical protein